MPPPIPTTSHHHAPLLLTLSSSHLSRDIIFSMKFSRYHFSDKILEISLVFTHGITPAWVNHNRCFVRKCILMFRAMHGHLASTQTKRTGGNDFSDTDATSHSAGIEPARRPRGLH